MTELLCSFVQGMNYINSTNYCKIKVWTWKGTSQLHNSKRNIYMFFRYGELKLGEYFSKKEEFLALKLPK